MSGVLTVVAKVFPRAGQEDAMQAVLTEQAAAVRAAEPDCLVYRMHRLDRSPAVFLVYEQYRSDAAFEAHRDAPHLATFRERQAPLRERPTEVEIYRSFTE